MNTKINNINQSEVLALKEEISYEKDKVKSKILVKNNALSVILFSFDKGKEIGNHKSEGDAFVTCIDGIGKIKIDEKDYIIKQGESIIIPANAPHSVYGEEAFKMLLVVVF